MTRRTVLRGGAVYTPVHPGASAFCVEGANIVWVGDEADAHAYVDGADEVIDLHGRLVTPAFVDAHVHLSHTGLRLRSLDLATVRSREAMLAAVERYVRSGDAGIVLGYGWDETGWPDPRLPTRTELDCAAAGRAVYLARVDGHSALISTGLVDAAADVTGAPGWNDSGRVDREAHHRARDAVDMLIPPGQREDALRAALHEGAAAGIGCVHEMSAPHINPADDLAVLRAIAAERPTVEVVAYWGELARDGGIGRAQELGCVGAGGDLCADGALGSRTAALGSDYADAPGHRGHLYLDPEEVEAHVVACTRAGVQAGFHCIGDAALASVVHGLRAAAHELGAERLAACRHRLEHAELLDPALIPELGSYGVVVSAQPAFDAAWGGVDGMFAARLGADRAATANPLASLARAGVPLAFGSDSPVTPLDPWGGVRAAVLHRTEEHRLTVETAFDAHTRGGWHAGGGVGGVLRAGADATYAVWADEPDRRLASGLPDVGADGPLPRCLRTVVRGQTVFVADG